MRPVRTGIGLSIGGVLFLVVLSMLGVDPRPYLGMATKAPEVQMEQTEEPYQESAQEAKLRELTAVVLADTEETWRAILPQYNVQYVEPTLVLFTGAVQSGCGTAESAMGPFYCPLDQKVYIDMSFYDDLSQRFGAPGDFAQAYVIAHEVGHHIQNQLGIMDQVSSLQQRSSETQSNALSVRLELQADFLAGVWAHYARTTQGFIDAADIEEGMNAASAVGDDRIMKRQQGYVVPDAFTHGTSEQRVRWFKKGLETGDIRQGDTFGAANL